MKGCGDALWSKRTSSTSDSAASSARPSWALCSKAIPTAQLALDRTVELRRSGYLVGDRFTVADLTAPAIFSPLVMPKKFQ
jgi:hypothetical protein